MGFLCNQYFSIQKYIYKQEFNPFRVFGVGDYTGSRPPYRLTLGKKKESPGQKDNTLLNHMIVNTNSLNRPQHNHEPQESDKLSLVRLPSSLVQKTPGEPEVDAEAEEEPASEVDRLGGKKKKPVDKKE